MTDRPTSASKPVAASSPPPQKRNLVTRILAAQWLPLVLLVLAVVFIAQNRARISINLSGPISSHRCGSFWSSPLSSG